LVNFKGNRELFKEERHHNLREFARKSSQLRSFD